MARAISGVLIALAVSAVLAQARSPEVFRGIYLTNYSAGSARRIQAVIQLAKTTALNTVVIDIKDATGYVDYDIAVPEVKRYGAQRVTIRDLGSLLDRLHQAGLYLIARIVVFEDPRLARARPDLAVQRSSSSAAPILWSDRNGLQWIDPEAKEAWDYNVAIARDALRRGFDEINFDYIRFPSDGNLRELRYPLHKPPVERRAVIRNFFAYLRRSLPHATISADLFGLATVTHDDLGIGQIIEDAYANFDYVCPMTYPALYAPGFLGYSNPAKHPYEVVQRSMADAVKRMPTAGRARLRPWLQSFSLHANYTPDMVNSQIQAVQDTMGRHYAGYLLWNPGNHYLAPTLGASAGAARSQAAAPSAP